MASPRRIVLTGASGYLGQHILHDLITNPTSWIPPQVGKEKGTVQDESGVVVAYHVEALYGSADGYDDVVQEYVKKRMSSSSSSQVVTVNAVKLDITDAEAVTKWLNGQPKREQTTTATTRGGEGGVGTQQTTAPCFDVCIHTAAMSSPRVCQEKPYDANAINVPKDFFNLLLCRGYGKAIPVDDETSTTKTTMMTVIALSTDQVYDGDDPPYIETDGTEPCNLYGKSKIDMEEYLSSLTKNNNNNNKGSVGSMSVNVVLLRSSIILGPIAPIMPNRAHKTFLHFIASRKDVDTDFYSDERRSVVAVNDVIRTIRHFTTTTKTNNDGDPPTRSVVYNMGGPESVSRVDMANAVFEHLGYNRGHIIDKKKAETSTSGGGGVPSPLDITMDSSKLVADVGGGKLTTLIEMVKQTFDDSIKLG